LIQLGPRV
jgi:hypothetical protein